MKGSTELRRGARRPAGGQGHGEARIRPTRRLTEASKSRSEARGRTTRWASVTPFASARRPSTCCQGGSTRKPSTHAAPSISRGIPGNGRTMRSRSGSSLRSPPAATPSTKERPRAHYGSSLVLADELGQLHRRAGARELARIQLSTATAMYQEMGMTYWLEKARTEMNSPGPRVSGSAAKRFVVLPLRTRSQAEPLRTFNSPREGQAGQGGQCLNLALQPGPRPRVDPRLREPTPLDSSMYPPDRAIHMGRSLG